MHGNIMMIGTKKGSISPRELINIGGSLGNDSDVKAVFKDIGDKLPKGSATLFIAEKYKDGRLMWEAFCGNKPCDSEILERWSKDKAKRSIFVVS